MAIRAAWSLAALLWLGMPAVAGAVPPRPCARARHVWLSERGRGPAPARRTGQCSRLTRGVAGQIVDGPCP
jgi:hypothetical protein